MKKKIFATVKSDLERFACIRAKHDVSTKNLSMMNYLMLISNT